MFRFAKPPDLADIAEVMQTRDPIPALRPYLKKTWSTEPAETRMVDAMREHVLPTGGMHLVFRGTASPDPAVAQALTQFYSSSDVREVVRASGYSHRRFLSLFRGTVCLSPKVYCRVRTQEKPFFLA